MSLKKKLITTISMFCLTIAMLMVGVWAVSSDQVSFGGTITFTATNILATISGEVSGTASDPTLQDLVYNSAGGPSSDALKTWSNNLAFKPAGTPFTIKITIQNDSNRKLYWDISDMAETNANISKSLSTYSLNTVNEIAENGKAEFTITISLSSTDNTVTGAYAYNINLFDVSEKPVDITNSNHAYLTFGEPDTTNKTISVTGCSAGTVDAVIPANVVKDGQTYKVTSIADGDIMSTGVFYATRSTLKTVYIPSTIKVIGKYAFSSCSKLTSITIPNGVETISGAFYGCGITSITVPNSVTNISSAFSDCSSLASVIIGSGVTSIGKQAFANCSSLTSITIPDSVTSIDDSAFSCCTGLTNITIPSSVTSIGGSTFFFCNNLTSITIPDSVISIGGMIFGECDGLKTVTIGSGVTSIPDNAFWGCDTLSTITLPAGITTIGANAFDSCTSLADVYYKGTLTQWNAINISSGNDPLTNATKHYAEA